MKIKDDRTPEQKKTHNWLVVGTDKALSGWGKARNGVSYAAWACTYDMVDKVEQWVRNRSNMLRVRVVKEPYYPTAKGHLHIYLVSSTHPAMD